MAQWLGIGTGKDGTIPSSGTYGGTNLACTGTAASTTLTYTGSFTVGDIVLIHQSRGTGVGAWELNQITGANTVLLPLANTYSTGAQVIEVLEYTGGSVSGTIVGSAWNGSYGGILPIMWNGKISGSGILSAAALGFRGGAAVLGKTPGSGNAGIQGEGSTAAGSATTAANTNGGGGGGAGSDGGGGGGGGAHAATATNGANGQSSPGIAGTAVGVANLSTAIFGGGGGSGGGEGNDNGGPHLSGAGAIGGGLVFLFGNQWTNTLQVTANGATGGNCSSGTGGDSGGAGGGGGGGGILGKIINADIGTNLFTVAGGSGGTAVGTGGVGGAGSVGRISLECCSLAGSSSPSATSSTGGHNYCSTLFTGMN